MAGIGFHAFDVAIRLLEEATFHPTQLYKFLDDNFGISQYDPFVQLGIYNAYKQLINAVTYPMGMYPSQATLPSALPPPPAAQQAMTVGGQRPPPSRRRKKTGRAEIFG